MVRKPLLLLVAGVCLTGCTPVRRAGSIVKTATLATTAFVAEGVLNGLLDSDESSSEKICRKDQERRWKEYWRDNPDRNPAMTEAFANE